MLAECRFSRIPRNFLVYAKAGCGSIRVAGMGRLEPAGPEWPVTAYIYLEAVEGVSVEYQDSTEARMRANVPCGYYPAGRMVYLNVDALKSIRRRSEQVLRQREAVSRNFNSTDGQLEDFCLQLPIFVKSDAAVADRQLEPPRTAGAGVHVKNVLPPVNLRLVRMTVKDCRKPCGRGIEVKPA